MHHKLKWMGALYIASKLGMLAIAVLLATSYGEETTTDKPTIVITQPN